MYKTAKYNSNWNNLKALVQKMLQMKKMKEIKRIKKEKRRKNDKFYLS